MAQASPDLAVVVVDYNAGEYLTRCIGSVLTAAGDATVEILVVDNASSDGSAYAALRAHPEIRLIANPDNRGLSVALNQGIRATSAPFLLFLNPDAEIIGGTLGGLVKVALDRPHAAAVGVVVRNPDGTIYDSGRKIPSITEAVVHAFLGPFRPDNRFSRAYRMADWDRASEREVDWVSLCCMLARRSAFDEIGPFDEAFFLYGEELDLCTRFRDAGWSVISTPEMEIVHEGGVSTGRSRRMTRMHSMSIYRYFAKHRADGWRKVLLPFAWGALRLRAELVSMRQASRRSP
jgi:N-acetylglucosaminyl-diphospho-decaprenol L-rhamnosyltransferase